MFQTTNQSWVFYNVLKTKINHPPKHHFYRRYKPFPNGWFIIYSHRMMLMMMMEIPPEYGQTYGTNVPPSVGSWNDQLCFHRWPELRPSSSRPSPRPRWSVAPCGARFRHAALGGFARNGDETGDVQTARHMGNLWEIYMGNGKSIENRWEIYRH
jgi:hypothetical protein